MECDTFDCTNVAGYESGAVHYCEKHYDAKHGITATRRPTPQSQSFKAELCPLDGIPAAECALCIGGKHTTGSAVADMQTVLADQVERRERQRLAWIQFYCSQANAQHSSVDQRRFADRDLEQYNERWETDEPV